MDERAAIIELLQERAGFRIESIHRVDLERAIHKRLGLLRITGIADYLVRLRADADEIQELLEELVVPETWFFRDVQPYECLRRFAEARRGRTLTLMSVPCSTGEEPVSMAITLLQLGFSANDFHIDAIDLSHRALECARRGCYGRGAFRGDERAFSGSMGYFAPHEGMMRVAPEVLNTITYQHGNLSEEWFLSTRIAEFDVIFCRNVLIYLADAVRTKVIQRFRRLLKADGMLYLGHSEGRLGNDPMLAPWSPQFPFAFTPRVSAVIPYPSPRPVPPAPPAPTVRPVAAAPTVPAPVSTIAPRPPAPAPTLDAARQLANSGQLVEASHICERLQQTSPTDSAVWCLLGVIRQAQGRIDEAQHCWERALYLAPSHYESLIYLALLAERRGDERQATQYRRRAERVAAEAKT